MKKQLKSSLLFLSLLGMFGASAMAAQMSMTIGNSNYVITLEDNEAVKLLTDQLPFTTTFENYGRNERIADLPHRLNVGKHRQSLNVVRGDLTYYEPWGNLAAFRVSYSSPNDLIKIGHMEEEAMKALENSGNNQVTFQLIQ